MRFLDDSPAEPAGVALPTCRRVRSTRAGARRFEDDRTRVLPCPRCRPWSQGPSSSIAQARGPDAGDVAISALEGDCARGAATQCARRGAPPRPRLGVQDLMTTALGLARAGAGRAAGRDRVPDGHHPDAQLADLGGRAIGTGLLLRMLAAPLLASLFVGLIVASLIARRRRAGWSGMTTPRPRPAIVPPPAQSGARGCWCFATGSSTARWNWAPRV